MSDLNELKIYLTDYTAALSVQLQADLSCASRSELIELLVLSQVHSPRDARALIAQRSKRGRRWPVVVPDNFVLPPEG